MNALRGRIRHAWATCDTFNFLCLAIIVICATGMVLEIFWPAGP